MAATEKAAGWKGLWRRSVPSRATLRHVRGETRAKRVLYTAGGERYRLWRGAGRRAPSPLLVAAAPSCAHRRRRRAAGRRHVTAGGTCPARSSFVASPPSPGQTPIVHERARTHTARYQRFYTSLLRNEREGCRCSCPARARRDG